MLEYVDKFEDLKKSIRRKGRISKCKACGKYPILKTLVDEMGWRETRIECECGLCIPIGGRIEQILDAWEQINNDEYTPVDKPYYVGKPSICLTCYLSAKCTEFRKMNEDQRMELVCGNYIRKPYDKD